MYKNIPKSRSEKQQQKRPKTSTFYITSYFEKKIKNKNVIKKDTWKAVPTF